MCCMLSKFHVSSWIVANTGKSSLLLSQWLFRPCYITKKLLSPSLHLFLKILLFQGAFLIFFSIASFLLTFFWLICYYIPHIRRIGGCYGFTSKPPAARHPPPAARNGVNAITQKTTGWIVLKFGIHIGSDSVLTWLTFQGRRSKVKVTASENDVIFSTFLNFHFLSHFPPKPSWGGHSNTPQQ